MDAVLCRCGHAVVLQTAATKVVERMHPSQNLKKKGICVGRLCLMVKYLHADFVVKFVRKKCGGVCSRGIHYSSVPTSCQRLYCTGTP